MAHRPQMDRIDVPWGSKPDVQNYYPFEKTPVPEDEEEDDKLGPGMRLNKKANQDYNTIEVILTRDDPPQANVAYVLIRGSNVIKVWHERERKNEVKFDVNNISDPAIDMTAAKRTVWVEWVDENQGTVDLTFEMRNGGPGGPVLKSDFVKFHTFNTLIFCIHGFTQGRDPTIGVGQLADRLRKIGFDAFLYRENQGGRSIFSSNHVRPQCEEAIEKRGVTYLAGIGYSYGGWKTWGVFHELNNHPLLANGTVTVPYTCYFDAIHCVADAEQDRPPRSLYHVNFYERISALQGNVTLGGTATDTINILADCEVQHFANRHIWFDQVNDLLNAVVDGTSKADATLSIPAAPPAPPCSGTATVERFLKRHDIR